MSKQWLHSFQSHVVVAALSDRALAIVAGEKDTSSIKYVYELLPAAACANSNGESGEATGETPASGASDGDVKQQDSKDDQTKKQDAESTSDTKGEIQAVCCTEIESHNWFAVSREDKTLSLYCAPSTFQPTSDAQEKVEAKQLQPFTVYHMPKRARCLLFSIVSSQTENGGCNIIIAGDLSGDSYAYPVPSNDSSLTAVDTAAATTIQPKSTPRRLLLGHTASILTGMQVVPSSSEKTKQFLLTADRDEKVRVSYFPDTHIIHGYLLGHNAFISAMDAVHGHHFSTADGGDDNNRTLCLTASGDGTVRLWDYQLCKEIGMVPVVLKTPTKVTDGDLKEREDSKTKNDTKKNDCIQEENDCESEDFDGDDDDDDGEESYNGEVAVPLAVAISSDSKYAVVARDGISSIDFHPIPHPSKNSSPFLSQLVSLHKKQTFACPSQPLDLCVLTDGSVLVLTQEPEYILHFKCIDSKIEFCDVTSTSLFCSVLKQIALSHNISMPMTTLEYNEDGGLKLQKKVDQKELENDNDEVEDGVTDIANKGGVHWNNAERRNTYKQANQRRRKRKLTNK
jgi:tRNA (guanine-N(7)-)-methyltransferase subunit TRM82